MATSDEAAPFLRSGAVGEFPLPGGSQTGRSRGSDLEVSSGRDRLHRRRIRLRQVGDRPLAVRSAAAAGRRKAAGRIVFDGIDVRDLDGCGAQVVRQSVGYVFQDPMTYLNPLLTVGGQVAEPSPAAPGQSRLRGRDPCARTASELGIADPARTARSYPHQLQRRHAPARDDRHGRGRARAANPR